MSPEQGLHYFLRMGKRIMAQPSPLSALCTSNEVAVVIEAGPEAESFVNANGSDPSKSSGAVEYLRTADRRPAFCSN